MEYSDFEILKVAHITNLFFTSSEDFKNKIGKSWEYIFDHQKNSDILNSIIYKINSLGFLIPLDITIREFVLSYLKVCNIWDDKTFWMELTTPRRRKEFCIYLLIHSIWPDISLELDSQVSSLGNLRSCYKYLERKFFPKGYHESPEIDPIMLTLVLYKVIRPIELSNIDTCRRQRLNPDKEKATLLNMVDLISDLKSRLPSQLDSIKVSIIGPLFDNYKKLAFNTTDMYQPSVAHWRVIDGLNRIETNQSNSVQSNMSGIWEDDKKLYWIFPTANNIQKGWITALRFEYKYPLDKAQIFVIQPTTIRNANTTSTHWTFYELCNINSKRFCKGNFKEMIEIDTVTLSPVHTNDRQIEFKNMIQKQPSWCDWNSFKQLSPSNSYFKEILSISKSLSSHIVLEKLGDEFSNPDYWNDTMIALDKEYIYLFDQWSQATPTIECDVDYNFSYRWIAKKPTHNLFSAHISKERPVYIIPRRPLSSNLNPAMKGAIENTDWDYPIMILHKSPDGIPYLFFPNLYVSIPLDNETMKIIGIRKITDSTDFFT